MIKKYIIFLIIVSILFIFYFINYQSIKENFYSADFNINIEYLINRDCIIGIPGSNNSLGIVVGNQNDSNAYTPSSTNIENSLYKNIYVYVSDRGNIINGNVNITEKNGIRFYPNWKFIKQKGNIFYIQNTQNNHYLGYSGIKGNAGIVYLSSNKNDDSLWVLEYIEGSNYTIKHQNTHQYLYMIENNHNNFVSNVYNTTFENTQFDNKPEYNKYYELNLRSEPFQWNIFLSNPLGYCNKKDSKFKCVPGFSTPVACYGKGMVACASSDGKNCYWGTCNNNGSIDWNNQNWYQRQGLRGDWETGGKNPLIVKCPAWISGPNGGGLGGLGVCNSLNPVTGIFKDPKNNFYGGAEIVIENKSWGPLINSSSTYNLIRSDKLNLQERKSWGAIYNQYGTLLANGKLKVVRESDGMTWYLSKLDKEYLFADNGSNIDTAYLWVPNNNTSLAVTYPGGLKNLDGGLQQRFYFKKCIPGRNPLGGGGNWYSENASLNDRILRGGDIISIYSHQNNRSYDCAWGPQQPCSKQPFPPPGGNWGTPYKIWIESASDGGRGNIVNSWTNTTPGAVVYFERMWYGRFPGRNLKSIICNTNNCYGSNYDEGKFRFYKLTREQIENNSFLKKNVYYTVNTSSPALCAPWGGRNVKVTYKGTNCNNQDDIQWNSMETINPRPGLSQSACSWKRSGNNSWNSDWVGFCGVAPKKVSNLPVNIKEITNSGYIQPGTGDCPGGDMGGPTTPYAKYNFSLAQCLNYCDNLRGCEGVSYNLSQRRCAPKPQMKCNNYDVQNGYIKYDKIKQNVKRNIKKGEGICAPWRGVNLGNNRWRCSNNQSYPGGIKDNGQNYTKKNPEQCKNTCQNMSNCKYYSVGEGNCMLFSNCEGPTIHGCGMDNGYRNYKTYQIR